MEDTDAKVLQLLNYCTTHPSATIRYHASNMILNIHSDAGYLSDLKQEAEQEDIFL
jgi:hypothetical protein